MAINNGTLEWPSQLPYNRAIVLGSGNSTISTPTEGNGFVSSSTITGTGTLNKVGPGKLTLSGSSSTWTGGTKLTEGILNLFSGSALSSGTLTMNGGTLEFTTSTPLTVANAISIPLAMTADISVDGATHTLSGIISGSGGLAKSGPTELILSGNNTYTGGTSVTAGTLTLGITNGVPASTSLALAPSTTFKLSTFNENLGALTGTGTVDLGTGTLTAGGSLSSTFAGNITGLGNFSKTGTGTLTLSGKLLHSGQTSANGGTLVVSNANSLSSSSDLGVGIQGTLDLRASQSIPTILGKGNVSLGANTLTLAPASDGSFLGSLKGNGGSLVKNGVGNFTLSGSNTYTGSTTVNRGTLFLASGSLAGTVTVAGNAGFAIVGDRSIGSLSGAGNVSVGNATLTLGGDSNSTTFSGDFSSDGAGVGLVTKVGSGTFTLDKSGMAYSGGITVSEGLLAMDGGSDFAAFKVAAGGMLGGGGTISSLELQSGGTLAPGGYGAGKLTKKGDLVLVEGSTLAIDLNSKTLGTGYDQVDVQDGNVSLGNATLTINLNYTPAAGDSYVLINKTKTGAVVGGLKYGGNVIAEGGELVVDGKTLSLSYAGGDGNDVVLSYVVPQLKIASVTAPSSSYYRSGDSLTFTVNVNIAATVTGTPRLALNVGGTTVYANYTATGSTSTALKFTYALGSSDVDTDGIEVGALELNGGTIVASSNSSLALITTFTAPTTTGVKVDASVPTVTSIQVPSITAPGGTSSSIVLTLADTGSGINAVSIDSCNISVAKGSTYLTITGGTYAGGNATYTFTPPGGTWDADDDGTYTVLINAGEIKDLAGNTVAANASAKTFTVSLGLALNSLSPTFGSTLGNTTVTLTGKNFTGATAVKFGATAATSFNVVSDTSITAVSPAGSAGQVNVTVTTGVGTTPTGAGNQFTYIAPPVIATAPQSKSVAGLAATTLSVSATGQGPLTYQWYFKGAPLDGQVFSTLTLPQVLASQGGDYTVKVTNSVGSVTSDPATLNVKPYVLNLAPDRMVGLGAKHKLFVEADGTGTLSYQWKLNGNPIDGATNSTYLIDAIALKDAGSYTVELSQSSSSDKTTSDASVLTALPNPISAMAQTIVADEQGVTAYFSIEGTAPKKLIIAAYGPAVSSSITGAITDPKLVVESATGVVVTQNDNWGAISDSTFSTTYARLGLTPLTADSKDAVVYYTFDAGSYRVRLTGVAGATGKVVLTVADADLNPPSRLSYVGVRGPVSSSTPLTGGFTMVNYAQKKMLLRAVSSTLGTAGLADPTLTIFDTDKNPVGNNNNWSGDSTLAAAFTQAGAFAIAADSKDAALIGETKIGKGAYTAQVTATSGSGDVLWEVFDLVGTTPTTAAPLVILPPVAQSVTGGNVTFSVTANGAATLGYQWKKGGTPLDGATNATLTLAGVTNENAGSYTVEVKSTGNAAVASASAVLKVTPKINSTLAASGIYGTDITTYKITATNNPTSFSATGLPAGLNLNTSTGEITGKPTVTSGSPYNVTIGATNADGSDSATLVFTVDKATLTITGVTSPGKVYDATVAAPLSVGSAALAGLLNSDTSTTVQLVTSGAAATFADANVGPAKAVTTAGFAITGTSASNYTLTQPTTTASITAKPLTVAGLSGTDRVYNGTDVAPLTGTAALLAAEAPGAGAADDGKPYTGDTVSLTGTPAGKFDNRHVASNKAITVTGLALDGAQAANYAVVQPTGLTASVSVKTLAVAGLSGVNRTYNATTTAGLSGTAALLTASAPGVGAVDDGKPYTGDDITLGGTIAATFASKDVGTRAITVTGYGVTGAQAGNYFVAQPTGLSADITRKTLAVTGLSGVNRTYNATTTAPLSGTAVLLAAESPGAGSVDDGKPYTGDTVSATGTTSGVFADRHVANGKAITVSGSGLTGAQAGNYNLSQQSGLTANVTAKTLTVVGLTGTDRIYNATTVASLTGTAALQTAGAPGSGAVDDGKPYTGDVVTLGGTAVATFDAKDVGARAITVTGYELSGVESANYQIQQPLGLTATISAKALTVAGLSAVSRVYDATVNVALSGTAALLTAGAPGSGTTVDGKPYTGDTAVLTGPGAAKFASKAIGSAKSVTVTGYTVTGAQASNYTVTQPLGLTADVTAKNLTVAGAAASDKVYDASTSATPVLGSATLVGVIEGDTVTLVKTAATGTFANANVGQAKPVQLAGLTLGGTDGTNYTVTQPATTASITPAPVSVAISNLSHTYDGTPKSATVTLSPSVSAAIVYSNTSGGAPINAGSYAVSVNVTDNNYSGSGSATLVIAKATQTVAFSLTGSDFNVGASLGLVASASSKLPVTFSVVSGAASISGTTATITTAGPVTLRATQAGSENYQPATADRSFTGVNNKAAQSIVFTVGDHTRTDAPFKLTAFATSGLPVSFAVVSGPAILNGDILTLGGTTGVVTVRASQSGNNAFAAAPDVLRSFTVIEAGTDTFFGDLVEDSSISGGVPGRGEQILGGERSVAAKAGDIAAVINSGNRTGHLLIVAPSIGLNVGLDFELLADGSYSLAFNGASRALTINGSLVGGILTGRIPALKVSFSTVVQVRTGPTANYVGYYESSPLNAAQGTAYSVVGPNGQALVLVTTPTVTAGATTTVKNDGTFVAQASNVTITGSVDAPTTTVAGSILVAGQAPISYSGLSVTTVRTDRLINLSSRVRVGPAAGRTLITGFVIGGSSAKRVLLRAVGPTLTGFGVSGALSNPRLQLYDGTGKLILENDDWSGTETATATTQVGAFSLVAGSKDAAVLTTLQPGSYTMHVIDGGETGVALAEIYDASGNPNGEYQRLINISTRGEAGAGENLLIGGFIITGNSPKKVLVRGIGPGLNAFGLTGTLTDPRLRVYDASGLIGENDNWSTVAADATLVSDAATATGAFALAAGSKDAALILTLAPGAYTAQVGASDGTSTGVALVEIYELPQ